MSHWFGGLAVDTLELGGVRFYVPADIKVHLQRIVEGSYEVPASVWRPNLPPCPTVLDLGANAGTFVFYAKHRWPGCLIDSFEPEPRLFSILQANIKGIPGVFALPFAVTKEDGMLKLYAGRDTGSATLFDNGEDRTEWNVMCTAASSLDPYDIIKVDIEGSEWDFLQNYKHLDKASYIAIEYHRDPSEADLLIKVLAPIGFVPMRQRTSLEDPGELVFVKKKDLVPVTRV